MRRMTAKLKATAVLAVFMAISAEAGLAEEAAKPADVVPTHSFSGAYLAGRAAEFDNDLKSAVTYYKRALALDPGNADLEQTLLLALISQGRMDEALPYAEKLKDTPDVERFSRMALAIDAFHKKDYAAVRSALNLTTESDLDRLITSIMKSWAKVGEGDVDGALSDLESLEGPAWYDLFTAYQRAMIQAHADRKDGAISTFEEVFNELAPRSVAPDTFGRIAEVYAAFLS